MKSFTTNTSPRLKRLAQRIISALALALTALTAVVTLGASASTDGPAVGPICFYQDDHMACVQRSPIEALGRQSGQTTDAEALLTALLSGPTPDERAQGLASALPSGARLVSLQTRGQAITVHLSLPADYLDLPPAELALASDASVGQIFNTLLPLGYRDLSVQVQDPTAPDTYRPLSSYLPPLSVPPKITTPHSLLPTPYSLLPSLSGKTIYISAGHGWQWNGSAWRTQRPPYPDSTTGYSGPIIEDHNNAEVVNQYLLRYLQNAGADVWTARERDLGNGEQIVDDSSPGFAASAGWETVDGDGYQSYYKTITSSLSASSAVTWTTGAATVDGLYALYVWYTPGADRASDARYSVYHAGGSTELSVDQRRHGGTWRYVGSFALRAGESLSVSLSNRSSTPGQVVVADAVRLGGGRFDDADLASNGGPVQTDAAYAPNEPWWETAAYYNVQRLGLDPEQYAYFNDVIARPLWARWEHANTGDDAVFISWHTNGYNGHNDTTWGTVSFIHSFQPVTGSAALRHAIHSELINDARAGWDPDWRDLGQASRDLGELRELWDSDAANAIPGVLLEIAYHDHEGDTDALKDPRFALLSARAVYQGLVKYYEQRDGVDLTLLPEPPTHLQARNNGAGQVRLSWRPSPTDSLGLLGEAAAGYRVYTSRDGLGWDGGQAVAGTSYTLAGLEANELIFVRVTAVNAGGESFPTPVLAARAGAARVLLVDGFDRLDRHGLILEYDSTEGSNARLWPEQINSFDYAIEHGQAITWPFDSALNEAVRDGDLNLASYDVVDWFLGEESSVDHSFDAAEQAALGAYLEGGGALLVSGAEIGWDLEEQGNGADFYRDYLGASLAGDDANTYLATPIGEGIFAGLGYIDFRDNYDVDYPDQLTPLAGSVAALNYFGGDGGVAALQYDAGDCRRVVYLGFPFETIAAAQRPLVMARALGYLGQDCTQPTPPQTTITTPVSGAVLNFVPAFGGAANGPSPIQRVEVQIVAPDGRYWGGQGWITASRWLTALGASAWRYPLPPSDGTGSATLDLLQGQYNLYARAWDTSGLSDTTPAVSHFIYDSISPIMSGLVWPSDKLVLAAAPDHLAWWGAPGDEGGALAYHVQVAGQAHVTSGVVQELSGSLQIPLLVYTPTPPLDLDNGTFTWRVRATDAAGNNSAWTPPWTFFIHNYALYLPLALKNYVEEGQPACRDVISNGGFETDAGWAINNTPVPAAYSAEQAHGGQRSMRLGIVPPNVGAGSTSYSSVDQSVPLPQSTGITLTFWLYPINTNGDEGDLQYVGLYDEEGTWQFLWSGRLDSAGWLRREIALTPFAGQVVNLRFSVKNDGDADSSALYVDDVHLEACDN